MANNKIEVSFKLEDIPMIIETLEKIQNENKQLKELKYKFFDNTGDEENFTLEDYLEISNKLYDYEQENKQLKERIDKAIENCKKSIESINQKLQDDKTIKVVDGEVVNMNEYQIVRLKAIRMKCKELLEILGDKENE